LRCFVAVEVSEGARASLARVLAEVQELGLDAKTVEPHNLHVTLVFLGELPDAVVEEKSRALERLRSPPFEAELRGLGFFPSRARINSAWAGVGAGAEELKRLQAEVAGLLGAREEREFTPHVALVRVRSARNLDALRALADRHASETFARMRVDAVVLKKSTLTPEGPAYEDLARVPLREA
jgi:2'-5' RNA ligase